MLNEGKRKQTKIISEETKKILANEVHKYPALWDANHEQYMKRGFSNFCWKKVAQTINMPVEDCKTVWKGLRDAINYRAKYKTRKSGDGSLEDEVSYEEMQSNFQSWPLAESLSFMIDHMINKSTTTDLCVSSSPASINVEDGNSKDFQNQYQVIEIINDPEQDDSMLWSKTTEAKTTSCKGKPKNFEDHSYDYTRSKRRKESSDCVESDVIKSFPELMESRKVDVPACSHKYDSIYANLDRMLKKLPESVVEDLNVQFINLTYAEVKKYGNRVDNVAIEIDRTFK